MKSLTITRVALRSIHYFFKSQAAVGLGIAAATAVIVGALVVGDSVRGSLRGLVLDRLANVQGLLLSRTFFEPPMVTSLKFPAAQSATLETGERNSAQAVVPFVFLSSATVELRKETQVRRAAKVQIFGVGDEFWNSVATQGDSVPAELHEDEVVVSTSLAMELGAQVGDEMTLRFHVVSGVPSDSPLGKRDDTTISLPRQKLIAIVADEGIGGLSFQSTQNVPRNVFCSLPTLQESLECENRVNAALVLGPRDSNAIPEFDQTDCDQLDEQLKPKLEDYGLKLERITRVFPDRDNSSVTAQSDSASGVEPAGQIVYDYFQLTSNSLILESRVSSVVKNTLQGRCQRVLTYLANTIIKIEPLESDLMRRDRFGADFTFDPPPVDYAAKEINALSRPVPYSTVVGMEESDEAALQEFNNISRESRRTPYCWINSWLAADINAAVGDWIEIKYFEPETMDGVERERSVRCMIVGIAPLTEPATGFGPRNRAPRFEKLPTIFNDPDFTPTVPGLTDKESMSNWDAPFELDLDLIQKVDDAYYEKHRLTPKVFLPFRLASSSEMFGSRFGHTTAIRFPVKQNADESKLRDEIETSLWTERAEYGFRFQPVRQQLLRSATGTTPFDMLFLSLSFFVIVSALMLVGLLFKLGLTQRASQLGLFAAQGFTPGRMRRLMLTEMTWIALLGAVFGVLLGLGYARSMIAALESWWLGAISSAFLDFSFTPQSLILGAAVGVIMSLATIYLSLRRLLRTAPLQLLRGQIELDSANASGGHPGLLALSGFLALAACALIVAALGQTGMARAGSFFGSAMLLLIAAIIATHYMLRLQSKSRQSHPIKANLLTMAVSTLRRNPLRSSLTLALLAFASFLIASMGVFHVAPDPRGYGGFDLLGESSQPIYRNISSGKVREELLGSQAQKLRDTYIMAFRMRPGDDASCNNLFQVAQPTVLGVPTRMNQIDDFNGQATAFLWSASDNPAEPWRAIEQQAAGDEFAPIPVILDQNTAAWSLKQGASLGAVIRLQYGERTIYFRTVGLLANSVLQGKLMISEVNFRYLFPEISGNSFFMIRSGNAIAQEEVIETLEQGWSAEGLDVTLSAQTLAGLLGVQNTYISAFQSLGALGLLLGTFGLIAVQLRSVFERREELALMQALGFSKSRIAQMLTLETVFLLGGGVLTGCLAAAVALVPYIIENSTQVSALQPLALLSVVLLVGFIAALIAVRAAMKPSVLAGLRGE